MSTFILAISYLTASNLPWFMDLTFQVPMQYCSLQHHTLLPSPGTSTIWCCFCFGSVSLFFLEFFLHWSPVTYWAPTDLGTSLVAQIVKCLPTMRETWVRSLGREDSLEKDMATPHQYSCLENPMDGGAWWTIYIVHGVTESWTLLSDFTFSG